MSDDTGLTINGPSSFRGAMLLLVIGLAATGYGAYDYVQQSEAVTNAVESDATITEMGVEADSSGSSTDAEYKPTVQFTYEYEGTSYTSTNVFPTDISPSYDTRSEAKSVLEGYETGDTVTAYVNPAEPGNAFLKNQTSNAPLLFVGIGLFFTVFGGVSAVKRYRRG